MEVDGTPVSLDADDVRAWAGTGLPTTELGDEVLTAYVRANPRPARDAQGGVNVPARQRMAILRRLAAGPASRGELLAVMRAAAGYVGGDDWRNRMDELRGRGQRGGGHTPLPIEVDAATETYRFTESFPVLSSRERLALAQVKAALAGLGEQLELGRIVLDGLLPDVGVAEPDQASPAGSSSKAAHGSSPRSAARKRR